MTERDAHTFWENHYQQLKRPWTGRPNAILAQWSGDLVPGRALDLGCSEGNSAVWLAQRGWQVKGVDISETALARAQQNAQNAGVADRFTAEQHDLTQTFPTGEFDLAYALYLESPIKFAREKVLQRTAQAVVPGGLLLIVQHASVAPWSWNQGATFPTPPEALDALGLDLQSWHREFLGESERVLTGPDGQEAVVRDTVIALRKIR